MSDAAPAPDRVTSTPSMDTDALLARLTALLPAMQDRAAALDVAARFPADDLADLRAAGVLAAPLPGRLGGLGVGTEPAQATAALDLFRLLGRGNLALGRLVEAHVNALRLVVRYGDAGAVRCRSGGRAGGPAVRPLGHRPARRRLRVEADGASPGAKQFCSGAGHCTRAVVTAQGSGQTRLAYAVVGRNGTGSSVARRWPACARR